MTMMHYVPVRADIITDYKPAINTFREDKKERKAVGYRYVASQLQHGLQNACAYDRWDQLYIYR